MSQTDFRNEILRALQARNRACNQFERIFEHDALAESINILASKNNRLKKTSRTATESETTEEVERLNNELAELYRKQALNAQQLIDTSNKLTVVQKELEKVSIERDRSVAENLQMGMQVEHYKKEINDLKEMNQILLDERLALQTSCTVLENKFMESDHERQTLIDRVKEMKEHEIHFINDLNDKEQEKQRQRLQSALEEAVKMTPPAQDLKAPFSETELAMEDSFEVLGHDLSPSAMDHWDDVIPERCKIKFECNELGEVTDLLWHPNGRYFFTAGNDKKIKMFELLNENYIKKYIFAGANQTITRIDIDTENKHILGSSNDSAVRIWSIDDQRHRYAFTGHTDKVHSAKFFSMGKKIASGSQDRTIKIWDITTSRCAKTFFPGSTVLDIATNDRYGMPLISAHYDKNVRFWDTRCDDPVNTVLLNGKVTSLFLSPDFQTILCLSRDETLSLIDLRNYNTLHTYSAEQFRTTSDSSRCVISPGGKYCAAGSADGQIFIWNTATTKLEKVLHKNAHEGHAVLSLSWHPSGYMILSGDKMKMCCIWK